jgi:hypothetical protein
MPLSPSFSSPLVGTSDTIESKEIENTFSRLEKFVNGGIAVSDIKYSSITEVEDAGVTVSSDPREDAFETRHILKPEYYVSGNPRIEGVSSDTFYRNVPEGKMNRHVRHETSGNITTGSMTSSSLRNLPPSAWQPIDGMSANIFVKGDKSVNAFVFGSMYAWSGGSTDFYGLSVADQAQNYGRGPLEGKDQSESQWSAWFRAKACKSTIGVFKLYVHRPDDDSPTPYEATERRVFNRGESSYRSKRSQISFATAVSLRPGVNKVSYRCVYRLPSLTSRLSQHLYVSARNLVVDVHYK